MIPGPRRRQKSGTKVVQHMIAERRTLFDLQPSAWTLRRAPRELQGKQPGTFATVCKLTAMAACRCTVCRCIGDASCTFVRARAGLHHGVWACASTVARGVLARNLERNASASGGGDTAASVGLLAGCSPSAPSSWLPVGAGSAAVSVLDWNRHGASGV